MNFPKRLTPLIFPLITLLVIIGGISSGFIHQQGQTNTPPIPYSLFPVAFNLLLLIFVLNLIGLVLLWFSALPQKQENDKKILQLEIKERQRLEDSLRHEISLLAQVMETSPVGILIIDERGAIIGASDRAEQILDITKEELSQGAFNINQWRLLDYDGNYLPDEALPFPQVLTTRQALYNLCHALELPNGKRILLSINASPLLDEVAELEGVVLTIEDITERVRVENALLHSEAQFRGLFEQAAVGIAIIALSGQFIAVNQRFGDLLGYSKEELLQKTCLEITYPEDREINCDLNRQLLKKGGSFSLEKRYLRADNSLIWVNLTASAIRNPAGQPMYLISIIEDISERKQALKALQESIETLEQRNRDMSLLSQMSDFLQACLTLEEAYQVISDRIPALFPHCNGGLFLRLPDSNLVELAVKWEESVSSQNLFSLEDCWSLRRGQPHHIDSDSSGLFCPHIICESLADSLCIPMTSQGQAIGLLYLNTASKGYLNESKRQFAETVAENLSLCLGNLQLRVSLQEQSIRDSLTNLYNYRYLKESLEREIRLANRKAHPIGIMMIDVDHFRNFNNTFGHDAGNVVLQAVSDFLLSQIRNVDIACRYGGEEFLLILPEMPFDYLRQRAEQIREGVKQLSLTFQQEDLPAITVSIGIASYPEHGNNGEDLIREADLALYQAKNNGRDCVKSVNS
jgi:diguanylate cyclase (GGDEF)-like protein/PAS domain S-box-containing protein